MLSLVSKFEKRLIDNNFRLEVLNNFAQVCDFSHNRFLSLDNVARDIKEYLVSDGVNIVIANGEFIADLSNYDLLKNLTNEQGEVASSLFAHNEQHLLNCLSIEVSAGKKLNIIYWFDDSLQTDAVYNLRQILHIKSKDKVDCREIFINAGKKVKYINLVMDYSIASHAKLELSQEHIKSKNLVVWQTHRVNLGESSLYARLDWFVNSLISLVHQNISFKGNNSECIINNASDIADYQRFSNLVNIEHSGKNCKSTQNFCAAAKSQGIGIIKSKVVIDKLANKSEANQILRGLLLDDSSSLMMSPELEIDNDDVACYHGASVGSLDKEGLVYLKARGFSEAQAQMVMMEALFKQLACGFDKSLFATNMMLLQHKWQGSAYVCV